MQQSVGQVISEDGTRIAYAVSGNGPPLVRPATWLTHIEADVDGPTWGHWWRDLSREHTLIRYDLRGTGLSQRSVSNLSLSARLSDLEAVVGEVGIEQFDLLGHSVGASAALKYAAKHPSKVQRIVVINGSTEGPLTKHLGEADIDSAWARRDLMLQAWDQLAVRRLWASWIIPDSTPSELDAAARLLADCVTGDEATNVAGGRRRPTSIPFDFTEVKAPALVLHSKGNQMVPVGLGKAMAEAIPSARFVELDSRNHILTESEPAWLRLLEETRIFLNDTKTDAGPTFDFGRASLLGFSERESQVLALISKGASDREIAEELGIERRTASNHVQGMLSKVGARNRAHAVALAAHQGLLR